MISASFVQRGPDINANLCRGFGAVLDYRLLVADGPEDDTPFPLNLDDFAVFAFIAAITDDETLAVGTTHLLGSVVPDQTGDNVGRVVVEIPPHLRPDVRRSVVDLVLVAGNGLGNAAVAQRVYLMRTFGAFGGPDAMQLMASESRILRCVMRSGPNGEQPMPDPISINLAVQDLTGTIFFTAAATTVLTGAKIRVVTATAVTEPATVQFVRGSDSMVFASAELLGLDNSTEARNIIFSGTIPVLLAGDTIRCRVTTAAVATALTAVVSPIR